MTTGTEGGQPHRLREAGGVVLGPAAVPLDSTLVWPPSRSSPGLVTEFRIEGAERGEGKRGEMVHPGQSSTMAAAAGGEKVMGNQHPLEQNHVTSSAIGMT